jgi:hypothetical protein
MRRTPLLIATGAPRTQCISSCVSRHHRAASTAESPNSPSPSTEVERGGYNPYRRWRRVGRPYNELLLEGILNFLAGLREVAQHLILLSLSFQLVVTNGPACLNFELALQYLEQVLGLVLLCQRPTYFLVSSEDRFFSPVFWGCVISSPHEKDNHDDDENQQDCSAADVHG